MLGRAPVIEGHDGDIQLKGKLDAEWLVGLEVSKHPPAAMDEHEHWTRTAFAPRIIEPETDPALVPWSFEIADHFDRSGRRLEGMTRGNHHLAGCLSPYLVALGPIKALKIVEELPHVGPDERVVHGGVICGE